MFQNQQEVDCVNCEPFVLTDTLNILMHGLQCNCQS